VSLAELCADSAAAPLAKVVQQKLSEAGQTVVGEARQLTTKLKGLVGRGQDQLTLSSGQMLAAFTPQLQKLVAHQLVQKPIGSVQIALRNEKFMRTFFGALYDCLPRPVCRFVSEPAFIQFCLEQRETLFTPDNERSLSNQPLSENSKMKTIAIIGASNDRNKFGNKAVRAFRQQGYEVFPVNPKEATVEGLPGFKCIMEVPVRPHKISVYLPPQVLLKVLPEIAAKGCDELWLNPGTESTEVLAEAERLGLNVVQACSIVAVGLSPEEL
jgi:predicted CoA-binding protein